MSSQDDVIGACAAVILAIIVAVGIVVFLVPLPHSKEKDCVEKYNNYLHDLESGQKQQALYDFSKFSQDCDKKYMDLGVKNEPKD
jgi:hypothetical protein